MVDFGRNWYLFGPGGYCQSVRHPYNASFTSVSQRHSYALDAAVSCPLHNCLSMPFKYSLVAAVARKEWFVFVLYPLMPACLYVSDIVFECIVAQWSVWEPTILLVFTKEQGKVKGMAGTIHWTKLVVQLEQLYKAPGRVVNVWMMYHYFLLLTFKPSRIVLGDIFSVAKMGSPGFSITLISQVLWHDWWCSLPLCNAKYNPLIYTIAFRSASGQWSPRSFCSHNIFILYCKWLCLLFLWNPHLHLGVFLSQHPVRQESQQTPDP